MKNLFYLYFISALFFASCDESISIDEEIISPPEEVIPPADPDENNTPSDFDFTTLQANDTLNIAYSHDLGGESIEIPVDVVINYNEGEIINGTFVFTEGKIAGELLNKDLIIEGTPTLTSTTFKFEKSKWEITEGEVSDDIALINKETLNEVIVQVKSYGAEVFQIDELDVFFWIDNELKDGRPASLGGIILPSDFTLEMTDNTHLRVQANNYIGYDLIKISEVSNLTVSGGNLYGDRDHHDYSPYIEKGVELTTHEWGTLILIKSGVNIIVDGVNLINGSGDGMEINSLLHTFHPDYVASSNILVSNCTFDSNRRNNLSITDGYDMIIENNTFLNAGIDTPYSKGTAPRYGIDIEAYRQTKDNGEKIYYQRARDIIIRNNIERGSANGAFLVAIGEDVIIENNNTEHSIGFTYASGVKIKGNTITFADRKQTAIFAGVLDEDTAIYNNEISGNTVKGHSSGIMVHNADVKVFDNIIDDCGAGIVLRNLRDAEVYNNKITSSRETSYGIPCYSAGMDNVLIHDNDIDVTFFPISFIDVNNEDGQLNNIVTVKNNNMGGDKVKIVNSNGIVVE